MNTPETPTYWDTFDLQGHRGARGLMPENTVPAFLKALEYDVKTLELDVVISKDNQIVVSHEPWMNHVICTQPNGSDITEAEADSFNLYQMTYEEIKAFDCGIKGNSKFPEQQTMAVVKPTLRMVVEAVNAQLKDQKKIIFYNIETKSDPKSDSIFHPVPQEFVKLLYAELKALDILEQTTVQSFDPRTLQVLHQIDESVPTALLVWQEDVSFDQEIATLGFLPTIYSPYDVLVDSTLIATAHQKGVKVVPWTVNEADKMKNLISLGVDGLITDYPNRARKVIDELME